MNKDNYPEAARGLAGVHTGPHQLTIRQNLDQKIGHHQDQIERLTRLKDQMPQAMLDMQLADLSEAMRW